MTHKTDMREALQLCIDAMLHDGVPTDPYHPRRVALTAAEAALASQSAGVPVAWQVRRADGRIDGVPIQWECCTKELYEATLATGHYAGYENGPRCEVRALSVAAPSPDREQMGGAEERCQYCGGTGDVHDFAGVWLGECLECKADASPSRECEERQGAAPSAHKAVYTLRDLDRWLGNSGYDADHPWRLSIARALASAPTLGEEQRRVLIEVAQMFTGTDRRRSVLNELAGITLAPAVAQPLTDEPPFFWHRVIDILNEQGIQWKAAGWVFASDDHLHKFALAIIAAKGE